MNLLMETKQNKKQQKTLQQLHHSFLQIQTGLSLFFTLGGGLNTQPLCSLLGGAVASTASGASGSPVASS